MHLRRNRYCRGNVVLSLGSLFLLLASPPQSSRAEESPPKVDLAALVQTRVLSEEQILTMVKRIAE